MTQQPTLPPYDQIRNAVNNWAFVFFLRHAVEQGKITPETFVQTLRVDMGNTGISFQQDYTAETLDTMSSNLLFSGLATCAAMLDTALDNLFGDKARNPNADVESARAILFMIRSAFARDPVYPTWDVTRERYKRVFKIPETTVQMDFRQLNGKLVSPEHFGGWEGFAKLVLYCQKVAKEE